MKTDKFDFNNIGKRMPYTLPPDSFDKMETNVFAQLKENKHSRKLRHRIMLWSSISTAAIAASIALFFMIKPAKMTKEEQLSQIDYAYACLSEADKNFLLDIYQEDIFINQEEQK